MATVQSVYKVSPGPTEGDEKAIVIAITELGEHNQGSLQNLKVALEKAVRAELTGAEKVGATLYPRSELPKYGFVEY
ncbi:MAG: hypothetical protein OXH06_03665 [Gemmatimonadetes bacterium]|nr:hypothetical protein [Gemmatimonadota bacterium]